MPRPCTVCTHQKIKEIDLAILNKESYRTISNRFDISKQALQRHVESGHINRKLKKAREIKDIKECLTLADKLKQLEKISLETIHEATASEDLKTKCSAIREYRATLELSGKVTGEYRPGMEITGKDGGPVILSHLSDDEVIRRAREIIRGN